MSHALHNRARLAAARSSTPLGQEIDRLRAENAVLRTERDQLMTALAAYYTAETIVLALEKLRTSQ